MIKNTYTSIRIPCIYYMENGSTLEHCKECRFFNGFKENDDGDVTSIDCLKDEIPSIRCHVTSFTMGGATYKARYYDKEIDGELERDEDGCVDYCKKCCFNKRLENGNEICLLRSGVSYDSIDSFCCYEGEIWEKVESQ